MTGYNIRPDFALQRTGFHGNRTIAFNSAEIIEAKLKSGETLLVSEVDPPLGACAGKVGCWWEAVEEDLLSGAFSPWLRSPYYIGEIRGEVAGYMTCLVPARNPEVGLVEFVSTSEEHRRKGVGTALLQQLIARFEANGGLALYLCTTNPGAGRMYENCGFDYFIGDGMRYLSAAAGDFDARYLAHAGHASVREAHWGDLPGASVLFCHPQPAWEIKEYLSHCFGETRFEGHFMRLMRRVEEDRGFILVLENPRLRVIGCAIVERLPTFHQQHVAQLSVRVAPEYGDQTGELLDAAAGRARRMGISVLQAYAAEGDDDAGRTLEQGGFEREAVLPRRLRTDNGLAGVAVYGRQLAETGPRRPRHEFYGERKPWQTERILARERR